MPAQPEFARKFQLHEEANLLGELWCTQEERSVLVGSEVALSAKDFDELGDAYECLQQYSCGGRVTNTIVCTVAVIRARGRHIWRRQKCVGVTGVCTYLYVRPKV